MWVLAGVRGWLKYSTVHGWGDFLCGVLYYMYCGLKPFTETPNLYPILQYHSRKSVPRLEPRLFELMPYSLPKDLASQYTVARVTGESHFLQAQMRLYTCRGFFKIYLALCYTHTRTVYTLAVFRGKSINSTGFYNFTKLTHFLPLLSLFMASSRQEGMLRNRHRGRKQSMRLKQR